MALQVAQQAVELSTVTIPALLANFTIENTRTRKNVHTLFRARMHSLVHPHTYTQQYSDLHIFDCRCGEMCRARFNIAGRRWRSHGGKQHYFLTLYRTLFSRSPTACVFLNMSNEFQSSDGDSSFSELGVKPLFRHFSCNSHYRVIPGHKNYRNDPASVFLSKYF